MHLDEIWKPANHKPQNGLYVVAVPLGNLGDITLRALNTLSHADIVVAEDTRVTRKLFAMYGIKSAHMVSFHEYTPQDVLDKIIKNLHGGKVIALVSDAGTPLVSDPGFELVKAARENGLPVYPVPGASSVTLALSISGLPSDRFLFVGFPPSKAGKRKQFYTEFKDNPETIVFLESPKRVIESLQNLLEVVGNRKIFMAREATKMFEEYILLPISELIHKLEERDSVKGEITLVLEGAGEAEAEEINIEEILKEFMTEHSLKDAVSLAAKQYNIPRKEVYAIALEIRQKSEE